MDELYSLIDTICEKYDCDSTDCKIIGRGYTSSILRMSDTLCIKITEKKTCPDFPLQIKESDNLCVPIDTFVSSSGKYYGYVQQYLSSICLQDFIINGKVLSEKDTAYIIYDVLKGLELLHNNNYVHRDFYPGNIMIHNQNGKSIVTIIDFDETQKMNATTKPCFRYSGYHAPEIVLYDNTYDEKSEVFAVGVIMWELLFGNCPFSGYNYFGAVIAKSWDEYQRNSHYYHQKVTSALMTLKDSIDNTENLSKDCLDLLVKLLDENRNERITTSDALNHTFFGFIRNERE
mgnify:CR=1 FL=1